MLGIGPDSALINLDFSDIIEERVKFGVLEHEILRETAYARILLLGFVHVSVHTLRELKLLRIVVLVGGLNEEANTLFMLDICQRNSQRSGDLLFLYYLLKTLMAFIKGKE